MQTHSRQERKVIQRLKDIRQMLRNRSYDEADHELRVLIDRLENDDLD